MLKLSAKIREEKSRKVANLREQGFVPAVLYGPKTKNIFLSVNLKEFENIYHEAGGSSLIELDVDSSSSDGKNKKFSVLIQSVEIEAVSQKPIHIDFYQPRLDEETTATVPLVFENEAPAVKDLGGTLVKNIYELEVRALPQKLPHEIKVDISSLKTFEDSILVKDLADLKDVKILKDPEESIVFASEPEKVEEELEKPIEEKVEEVERTEDKKEEEKEE